MDEDLVIVAQTIVVRVRIVRIGSPQVLRAVRHAVAVGRVAVAVRGVAGVETLQHFPAVPHSVPVRVRIRGIQPPVGSDGRVGRRIRQ